MRRRRGGARWCRVSDADCGRGGDAAEPGFAGGIREAATGGDEMIRDLKFGREGVARGSARHAVVLLHGYGADGADLLGLADPLGDYLPDTVFLAPDAPEPCRGSPMGRQWFPIPWLDGSGEAASEAGLLAAADDLDGWLDAMLAAEGLTARDLILAGFSQGAMMALHVGLRRSAPVAGIVAIAGRLLAPERLAAEMRATPPVLLIHGDVDPVVPFRDLALAETALTAAGVATMAYTMRGTGHGIAPDGLRAAVGFIRLRLGIDPPPVIMAP